jgi:NADH-quinone oxidoreductase subunit A
MLANYAFIGVFFLAALSFPAVPLLLAFFLRPKRPTPIKQSTYECGLEVIGDIRVQFKVQYYLYALAYVIFGVEVVFLYPWAVAFDSLGLYGFACGAVFIGLLFAGLIYEWRKGALEWV